MSCLKMKVQKIPPIEISTCAIGSTPTEILRSNDQKALEQRGTIRHDRRSTKSNHLCAVRTLLEWGIIGLGYDPERDKS